MVATEHDAIARQADAIRNAMDEVAEVRRRHAGIAAVLVDLVGGRLDQRERRIVSQGMRQRRLDRQRVRGTYGIHSPASAGPVARNPFENRLHLRDAGSAGAASASES